MQQDILRIGQPDLFSLRECLWFLDRGYDDCLFRVNKDEIIKAILIDGEPVLFSVSDEQGALAVKILKGTLDSNGQQTLKEYILDWFDMRTDLAPFYQLLQKDKRLAYMSADYRGLRLINIADLFEALCWSIIGQQINLTFAYKLKRRLVEAYSQAMNWEGHDYHLFPACTVLANCTVADLKPMQFSDSKARYLIGVAQAFADNKLSREIIDSLPNYDEKHKALTAFKGIGTWTANYVLMKTLREPTAIPHGDVGLLKALTSHRIIEERDEVEKISRFFKKYKGWESYLVFYLWRSLS